MIRLIALLLGLGLAATASAQSYAPVSERPPALAREFRGAWIACIYNLDWPSSPGLSAGGQQAEMRGMLDKLAALKINAVIFQVRPQCDAVYSSAIEPWCSSLTGTMGRSPGYDPLAYCIQQAHARGIEVHAWFNPFRALSNNSQQIAVNHVSRTAPGTMKRFGNMTWCDPASADTRSRALNVILDVVKRYDVDGVHLDDYFYPYPSGKLVFADGKAPPSAAATLTASSAASTPPSNTRSPGCAWASAPSASGGPAYPPALRPVSTATKNSPATLANG